MPKKFDWQIAAMIGPPEKAEFANGVEEIEKIRLDVTDVDSIKSAIAVTIKKFG